ncbi:MAG: hypothetical protein D6725_13080 [Planctomycetota bacterium]|nr:MAG: hypothetical protein D6725_13080 [Planctomycetota bacterium]
MAEHTVDSGSASSERPWACRIEPQPLDQTAVILEGREVARWHFHPSAPRPFFYPLIGPSGRSVTRIGHPGAPSHDHHRSVWFAHASVSGIDFWSDRGTARIRQQQWLVYEDGPERAALAVRLHWYDGHDPAELLRQDVVAIFRPDGGGDGGWLLELHTELTPRSEMLELGQTPFGLLAVRVAASISEHFGGGRITGANGGVGEPANFGRPNPWIDYSGPNGRFWEGITYFDHPGNPGFPNRWHVREDGWMGVSLTRTAPRVLTRREPLRLRYLLHVHSGPVDRDHAAALLDRFASMPFLTVRRSAARHRDYELAQLPDA